MDVLTRSLTGSRCGRRCADALALDCSFPVVLCPGFRVLEDDVRLGDVSPGRSLRGMLGLREVLMLVWVLGRNKVIVAGPYFFRVCDAVDA